MLQWCFYGVINSYIPLIKILNININIIILDFLCRVIEYLGSGQFATVNKALWRTGGYDVEIAVKMIKTGASEVEKIKFLQEAAVNGQFHHINIVRLLGVVTVGEPVRQFFIK